MIKQRRTRAPRVIVPNNEQAVITINADQFRGTLCLLSRNGGTIRLARQFAAGTLAHIEIITISGKCVASIQLLRMARGNAQAFRFVQIGPIAQSRLEDALSKMRAQGLGISKPNALNDFVDFARRIMTLGSTR